MSKVRSNFPITWPLQAGAELVWFRGAENSVCIEYDNTSAKSYFSKVEASKKLREAEGQLKIYKNILNAIINSTNSDIWSRRHHLGSWQRLSGLPSTWVYSLIGLWLLTWPHHNYYRWVRCCHPICTRKFWLSFREHLFEYLVLLLFVTNWSCWCLARIVLVDIDPRWSESVL